MRSERSSADSFKNATATKSGADGVRVSNDARLIQPIKTIYYRNSTSFRYKFVADINTRKQCNSPNSQSIFYRCHCCSASHASAISLTRSRSGRALALGTVSSSLSSVKWFNLTGFSESATRSCISLVPYNFKQTCARSLLFGYLKIDLQSFASYARVG